MELQDIIYTMLRSVSAIIGFYGAYFFLIIFQQLPQPPHQKYPFLMLGVANLGVGIVYTLAVFHFDGFGNVSNVGRVVQPLLMIYQIMPILIAKHMRTL